MQIGPDLLQDPAILDLLGQEGVMDKVFDPSVFTPGTSLAGSVLPGDPFMQDITPDQLRRFIQSGIADNKTPAYSGTNTSPIATIATGQAYAQSIAGGMPFEQVVAPGMSFSPEFPMGYTQFDLTPSLTPPIVDDGPTLPPIIDLPPPDAPPIDAPPIFLPPRLPEVITPDPIQYAGGTPGFDYRGETLKPEAPISIGGPGGLDVEGVRGLLEDIGLIQEAPEFDPTPLEQRIGLLEQREMPMFDPSGIYSQIGGLQEQITGIPMFDPSDLQRQIDINRQIIGDIPTYNDAALRERIAVLENQQPMPFPEISITMPEPIYSALPVGPSIPFDPTKPPPPISIGGPGLGPVAPVVSVPTPVVSAPVVTTPAPIVDQIVSPIRTGRSPVRAMPVGLMSR